MLKSKYIFLIGIILIAFACDNLDISPSQADSFFKLYGSVESDKGVDVKCYNGGYLILSTITRVNNDESKNTEIALYQTDKYGNLLNNNVDTLFTSVRGGNNTASKLLLTSDGGFIVLGTVVDTANNNKTNIYVEKFKSYGTPEWEKIIGTNNDNEVGSSIKKASSGYIIAGSTDAENIGNSNSAGSKDVYMVKIDDNGNVEWTANHGGSGDDYSSDIILKDNGYVIIGTTNSFNEPGQAGTNIFIVETNLYGTSPDFITYGSSNNDYGRTLVRLEDGGYLILGTVENTEGKSNIYTLRVEDNIHNIVWNKEFGTTLNDFGYDVISFDEGFDIVGSKELTSGTAGYFLKIDGDGIALNGDGITYGGYGQSINCIEPTSDGGYIMVGNSGDEGSEMICLIKVNAEGEL